MPNAPAVAYESDYSGFVEDAVFAEHARMLFTDRVMPMFSAMNTANASLLDVGCGNGQFLSIAQDIGLTCVGIDTSPAAVEATRRRGFAAEAGPLSPDLGRFDVVTLWDVIEHIADVRALARDLSSVVKPGGLVVIKTPRVGSLAFLVADRIGGARGLLHYPNHVQFFSERSLALLLETNQFAPEVARIGRLRGTRPGSLSRKARRAAKSLIHSSARSDNLFAIGRRHRSQSPAALEGAPESCPASC